MPVAEARLAGGKALVAAGGDHGPLARPRQHVQRQPQRQARGAVGQPLMPVDRMPASTHFQRAAVEEGMRKAGKARKPQMAAIFHGGHRACGAPAGEIDAATAVTEICVAAAVVEPALRWSSRWAALRNSAEKRSPARVTSPISRTASNTACEGSAQLTR